MPNLLQRARFYLAQPHVLVFDALFTIMVNRLQSAPHAAQIAGRSIISLKTALTQKDARCANLKVTCLVIRSASSFLKMKLMSLHLLVRTTVCPTFIHATSTSSASAIGLRNTPSNTLRLCAVGISRGQRRYNQLNQPLMPKKLGNLSLLPPALQTIRWP